VPGAACSAAYGKILTCPARANRTRSTNHWAFTGGSRTGQRPFVGDCGLVYAGGRERVERHSLPAGGGVIRQVVSRGLSLMSFHVRPRRT